MLNIRNVYVLRSLYLFFLKLCAWMVYGRDAANRVPSDGALTENEVMRIRRINSELEIGPREWEKVFARPTWPANSSTQPALESFLDGISCVSDAAEALGGDSLTSAFTSVEPEPWNFMLRSLPAGSGGVPAVFLPLWLVGVWVRYCILLPVRIGILCVSAGAFVIAWLFFSLQPRSSLRSYLLKGAICFFAGCWVASFGGVVRYHGQRPNREPNQIYVANHTSLTDAFIMMKDYPFSLIGQRHGGLVGALEDLLLKAQSHVWFERSEGSDRRIVQALMQDHIAHPENEPILIFPEGTCVNNEYCIMFKKGCFELGASIHPVAIKYNNQFCDPFWNSSQQTFIRHILDLMTSWAVVADVYYLEPQYIRKDESSAIFAARVKRLICQKADLIDVNWDGSLKRNRISAKFMEQRQKLFAEMLVQRLDNSRKAGSAGNLRPLDLDPPRPALGHRSSSIVGSLSELGGSPPREADMRARHRRDGEHGGKPNDRGRPRSRLQTRL